MKIAHLLPLSASFPLAKHNGRYSWALDVARWQAANGHNVTIFAGPDSRDDSGIAFQTIPQITDRPTEDNTALINAAFADHSFDIFHSHFDYMPHTLLGATDKPLVTTQHWFPNDVIADGLRQNPRPNAVVVPVTKLMHRTDEEYGINCSEVIYHGVDLSLFAYNAVPATERLLFVGRITADKGVREAIQYALQAHKGLDIIGKLRSKDQSYWNEIAQLVDGQQIAYLGPKPHSEVVQYMQNAQAMIFPSQKPEAFGLVTIEAQACGTPVIISSVGASDELVANAQTGFVVSKPQDFVQAIQRTGQLSRQSCRQNAERFDINAMYNNYLNLYERLRSIT